MRAFAVPVLLALGLAGCLEASPAPAAGGEAGTFRFIEVTRDFRADPDGTAGVCGFPPPPTVDEADRTLAFHGDWPGRDHRALLLTVTWDRTRCAVAHTTWATSHQWSGAMTSGDEAFAMAEDGALVVDGEALPLGGWTSYARAGVFPDGRAWDMTTTVRDHGDWPLRGLTRAG